LKLFAPDGDRNQVVEKLASTEVTRRSFKGRSETKSYPGGNDAPLTDQTQHR
jgi:hypothetical protein